MDRALAPGGQLAVQVPANGTHASHTVANEVGATEPFLDALGGEVPADPSASNVLAPEEYARILFELGYETQQVTLRVYPHVLDSSSDVVEWVRGTNLNRFFERLPADLHEPFVEAYRPRCSAASVTWRRTSTRSSGSSSGPADPDRSTSSHSHCRLRRDFEGQCADG